ncbi:MAG: hypothetical protein J6S60_07330 [Oscillospiraceae bacterium]|nr:hypothetical protein [Oscillospiraceae bacterium]
MKDYDNSVMARLIEEKIHNAEQRDVLKARLIDGKTYEKIAEDYKISPRKVGYIIAKYASVLREMIS